ncbi:hypothetical protein GCM10027610_002000 [Dactylosporangium cerinum]
MDLRGLRRLDQLKVAGAGLRVAQVLPDGGVQQVRLLADHPDDRGEIGEPDVAQVDAVDGDPAAGGVVQAGDERGDGALAGAGLADEGEEVPAGTSRLTPATAAASLPG